MAIPDTVPRRKQLTGSRIREHRMIAGLKQAELAQRVGISASYLNLIEHNRRRIGGKLLLNLARALAVEPSTLSEGTDATVRAALRAAADAAQGPGSSPAMAAPEMERIDEMAARFPGWTSLIATQEGRIAALNARIEGLTDRLTHDPVLAEAMHEVLSSVSAIRSTADILVQDGDIDPAWRGRFHRNLHEEAERLSARATGLLDQVTVPGGPEVLRPAEQAEALFDAHSHHFAGIETDGLEAIEGILDAADGVGGDPVARTLAARWLEDYAAAAERLPLARVEQAFEAVGHDPTRLIESGIGPAALVLRRLASLPPRVDRPDFGLAVVDASGAILFRKRQDGFTLPRYGAGCPSWPIYRVQSRPGQPEAVDVTLSGQGRFRTWSVAEPVTSLGFGLAPVVTATMLVQKLPVDAPAGAQPPIDVGSESPIYEKLGRNDAG